ncbi:MAG TPA: aminotransferase class I/II-fold pyridoxal phosphate-dependent enzyme [Vicinamibacterales bacterium]|nr:aminotransferase class I/II-fold pyridoxal phosphate-dependent enzyme [Vicinamibacterales bacterium]
MTRRDTIGPRPKVTPDMAYVRPRAPHAVDLALDGNEGSRPSIDPMLRALGAAGPELLRRYPDAEGLEAALASRYRVERSRVLVTAGADEAIDRCCRAFLEPGRSILIPEPGFEMLERYAALAGGGVVRVKWPAGPFPTTSVLERLDDRVAIVAVVSPNNPTGEIATRNDVQRLAAAAPGALILLDHAYVEYADEDLTAAALALPNVVVTRTFSKAWGLAGCRVGFALGPADVIGALRAAGGPYPVAAPSVLLAASQLEHGEGAVDAHVARVRSERTELTALLRLRGVAARDSQANFVYADFGRRAPFVHAALAAQGILVRSFAHRPGASSGLRVTLPGEAASFARLTSALDVALAPEALLLDLDGVLADVEASYRACVLATARTFGVTLTRDDVLRVTMEGNANNDWLLTQRLLAMHGVERSLDETTACYQSHYIGTGGTPGLRESERLIVERSALERLARRLPIAIVTGRPRDEAEWFLDRAGIRDLVQSVVAMDDAPAKPDPAPVRLAMQRLCVARAWMVGDTPDDVRAARGAGALAIGIPAPVEPRERVAGPLIKAGAAVVLDALDDLLEVLP